MSKILVANLKSNYTLEKINIMLEELQNIDKNNLIICPSSIYIPYFLNNNYQLGIQNISPFKEGAYTGEIAATQVASLGVNYAIIGHFERRKLFDENSNIIKEKIARAIEANLQIIYCISKVEEIDVLNGFENLNILVVYEPLEAIGASNLPDILNIKNEISRLKKVFNNPDIKILYGGSVDDKNINDIIKIDNIDGVMLCTSALNKEKFLKIKEVIDSQ